MKVFFVLQDDEEVGDQGSIFREEDKEDKEEEEELDGEMEKEMFEVEGIMYLEINDEGLRGVKKLLLVKMR